MDDGNYSNELESGWRNSTTGVKTESRLSSLWARIEELLKSPGFWVIILSSVVFLVTMILLLRWLENIYARLKSRYSGTYIDAGSFQLIDMLHDSEFDDCPHSVEPKKFEDYVKRTAESGELEIQFKMLPRGLLKPCHYGLLPMNIHKNRSNDFVAYDETRVILGEGSLGYDSDYINANYIEGYCKEKAYIATQGPISNTIVDFWRMIWQEEVRVICMLVDIFEGGEKMCEQYWPEVEKLVEHGHITILNMNQRRYAHYTYRTFQLTSRYSKKSRQIKHLQYTGWPPKGVPMYSHSIVDYLDELRATSPGPAPIVVHCSTGAGRTGTIILCDICLRYIAAEGTVYPFNEAKKMYKARANMLDNLQQYVLAHLMPMQCLFLQSTRLPCSDVSSERIAEMKQDLQNHMKRLAVSAWKEKALRPWQSARLPNAKHIKENRFPILMPGEQSLVSLRRYPPQGKNSDYISAVSVDGVEMKNQYIASQLPLPTTLSNCWRLVAEKKVKLIIMLQRPDSEDSTAQNQKLSKGRLIDSLVPLLVSKSSSGPRDVSLIEDDFRLTSCIDVIPNETTPLLVPVPYLKVEHKMGFNYEGYFTKDDLLLTDSSGEQIRTQNVTVLTCNNWGLADNAEPPPPEILVALWSVAECIPRGQTPTLVLCHDGVTGCGLYLAMSFLLERMAVEQELDVILAVRAVRRSRQEFVKSKEQFEYLYDVAFLYHESFETYANFTPTLIPETRTDSRQRCMFAF